MSLKPIAIPVALCSVLSLFTTNSTFGQQSLAEKKIDSIHKLNEVVVAENRMQLPFSKQNRNIWIIDSKKIKTLPVRSVSELLSYVSGIDVRQRGPGGLQADISIDGGTFDQSLVLINGIKVSDPQTGHHMMNLPINVDDIDHIEVLRGSASRIYGLNALTGAINIVTRNPKQTGVSANVFAGSSFNEHASGNKYHNYGIRASGSLALAKSSHLFSAGQEAGNGYRYNTAFNNQKVYYQGKYAIGKTDAIDVLAGYVHNNFGANGFYSSPGDKESEETVETTLASIAYTTKFTDNWIMVPRISYRSGVDDYLYIKQTPDKFHNHHKTNVFDAELNNTIYTTLGTFGLGLEARSERINSSNLGERNRSNAGVFGEFRLDLVERLMINAGVYTNYNTDFGWQVFPGLDAGYNFYGNWRAFANIGTGQRLPSFTDLHYKGPTNIGNDQLSPEKSSYAESGIKFNNERLALNLSYFIRRINNFIDWTKSLQADPWQPQNYSRITTQGLTFSGDYTMLANSSYALSNLRAGLSYTNLNPRLRKTLSTAIFSRYALESLRNQLSGTISADLYKKLSFTATTRYCERISYKNYVVMDVRLGFKQKHYSIYADGANLFNVQYIEAGAVPMPGSWFTLGLKSAI